MPAPTLVTDRLVLAPLRAEDAARLFEYRSDPAVARFQSFEPRSIDDARAFIAATLDDSSEWSSLGIRLAPGDTLAGDVGIRVPRDMPLQAEVGVTVAPDHQRRGIAAEALTAVLDHLFTERGLHRAFASVDPRNVASMTLFERLGMRQEARMRRSVAFKGGWADDVVFAILESEWDPSLPEARPS